MSLDTMVAPPPRLSWAVITNGRVMATRHTTPQAGRELVSRDTMPGWTTTRKTGKRPQALQTNELESITGVHYVP